MPIHCVKNTFGAHFPPSIKKEHINLIIEQGIHPNKDNYSCFNDIGKSRDTGLQAYLQKEDIQQLFFIGMPLTTNLKYSLLDALSLDYKVLLIDKGYGVGVKAKDKERQTINDLKRAGAVSYTHLTLPTILLV